MLGPLCAGNRVSNALYDPKASPVLAAFPSPAPPPPTPAVPRVAFRTHSRWEARRSSPEPEPEPSLGEAGGKAPGGGLFLVPGRGAVLATGPACWDLNLQTKRSCHQLLHALGILIS